MSTKARAGGERPAVVERYSPRVLRFFVSWLSGFFAKSFDGVRIARGGPPPEAGEAPMLFYANHPSWWDPIHFLLLGHARIGVRRGYGPMDAEALKRYRIFERLGIFGVEQGTRAGAAEFLRTSRAILAEPGATLWITAQGEFADPRARPLVLRPGVAHLARELEEGFVVPLALDYPFWNEKLPEALSRFGAPIDVREHRGLDTEGWSALLTERLRETMDTLTEDALARDPERFETLVSGKKGVGGFYDRWRRLKAMSRGERFNPAHGDGR